MEKILTLVLSVVILCAEIAGCAFFCMMGWQIIAPQFNLPEFGGYWQYLLICVGVYSFFSLVRGLRPSKGEED